MYQNNSENEANHVFLVKKFQVGDLKSFETLISNEAPFIKGIIRKYIHSAELSDDLFQETCLTIWRVREQLRSPEKFRSWMFQITRNTVFSYIRKKNWQPDIVFLGYYDSYSYLPDTSPNPREVAQNHEWKLILNEEIANLNLQTQEMLILRFEGGLKLREISEVLNIPLGTVCVEINKALKFLRRQLKNSGIEFNYNSK